MEILCIIVSWFTIITNTILSFIHFQLIQKKKNKKNNFPRLYGIVHYIIWFALVYHCLSFGYNEQFALRKIWGLLNLNLLLSRTADVASSMYSAHASSVVISLAVQTIIINSALAWLFLFSRAICLPNGLCKSDWIKITSADLCRVVTPFRKQLIS